MPEATLAHLDPDAQLVTLWLHGRSARTQATYGHDVARFQAAVATPLAQLTLAELQAFADSLGTLAPATQARILSAVKSLLAFGHRLGVLPVNVGAPLRLSKLRNTLATRILPEAAVQRLLALEPDRRNRVLLRLLYAAGVRVSEVCGLRWGDVQERADGGQVLIHGKGGKSRAIVLSAETWAALVALRGDAGAEAPVFRSRKGGHLTREQVFRIVQAAARRAEIPAAVSPHWLRHAHASHALDRGAPIHLVQATLGHASVATTGRYLHARPTDSSARYLAV
jgi:integrase/recombinase XerD